MIEGPPNTQSDAPPMPPPDVPGAQPGTGSDSPGDQPPHRRLIRAAPAGKSPFARALRDAAALALDALDYAGDRIAEKLTGDMRAPK